MSYQIAIIIKASDKLSDMLAVNRSKGQATQLGWWIPSRGEAKPPEKWTMNIADIYLKTDVTTSEIEMRQTIYEKGLYYKAGQSIDGYNLEVYDTERNVITTHNVSTWKFDSAGKLDSFADNEDTIKSKDEYFMPVQSLTKIEDDRLVIVLEGTSLKLNLPEIRGGSEVPFYFEIIDFDKTIEGRILRQQFQVNLKWSEDYNGCNEPADCVVETVEEGTSMLSAFAASSIALAASLLAF